MRDLDAAPAPALYVGRVMHTRHTPFRHHLAYRVFSLWCDPDDLNALERTLLPGLPLFGVDRFGVLGLHRRDHGPRDGADWRPWAEAALAEAGLQRYGAHLRLLCFPRVLGYTFNPLRLFYGYDRDGQLGAMLYQVSNTFGQNHTYVRAVCPAARTEQQADKRFYVSPFIPMQQRYQFTTHRPDGRFMLRIDQSHNGQHWLTAVHVARRRPYTATNLGRLFASHPLLTHKIMAGIHWQALKLFLKGARFHHKPPAPDHPFTTD
jgi:DUF1365 family protein